MKRELAAGTLDIPARFEAAREKFETVISKANSKIPVHDKGKQATVRLKNQVMISPEFLALWDKIKGRTAYRVAIDEDAHRIPDFLRMVDNECFMSHKTVADVLFKSGRLQDFLNNPQKFVETFIETVKRVHNSMKIDGIRYMRLESEEYFMLEIFDSQELIAYLDKNAVSVENSVYDHIIYDSDTVELPFAKALDDDPDVKMFF